MDKIALRSTVNLIDKGSPALFEEPDPDFASQALPGQMGLAEVLLRNDPDNPELLELAAEAFNGYAFLFLEQAQPERAKRFYLRGRDYGLRLLARKRALSRLASLELDAFQAALAHAKPADAPGLFWAGFGWAGAINLSKDSPESLAELPKAAALMTRVEQLAPDYHFAGADLFFGAYYASRPAILGGDLRKAKSYFEDARRRTAGKYLMAYVLEARYFAVAAQDRDLFSSLLDKVAQEPAGQLPDARLTDEVAKRQAADLKEKINDLF